MRTIVKLSGIIAVSIALTAGLAGCGILSRDKPETDAEILMGQNGQTLWESGLQYVKIVNRDLAGTANDHPAAISSDELRTVLGALYVNERTGFTTSENPLFSASELQILSAALSSGLNQAKQNEDVNFVTIGSFKGLIAQERKTNSGRVFMSGGRLNIVFGLIHEIYRDKDLATGQDIDRRVNPLLPGSRKSEANLATRVSLDSGQSFYLDPKTGKERSDWLVIDIATVLAKVKERKTGDDGTVSPELLQDVARSKQETGNLRQDVGNMKEILFDMSGEIDRLKQEIEALKATKR
ncbi:hypothetical protein LCGC14_0959290 [marine sediment metagenome]|uniref:Uncharacterized protein n=1 Tax=marine sediment metagenome TaxID=412755 RepID=A0A0F9NEW0_9ZZZZ|nr:hypothetical protein [Methylophaga sp.]